MKKVRKVKKQGCCPNCGVGDNIYMPAKVLLAPVGISEGKNGVPDVEVYATDYQNSVGSSGAKAKFYCDNCSTWFNNPYMI